MVNSSSCLLSFRVGLINIALRYTRFLNTLKYKCMRRGFSNRFSSVLFSFFFLLVFRFLPVFLLIHLLFFFSFHNLFFLFFFFFGYYSFSSDEYYYPDFISLLNPLLTDLLPLSYSPIFPLLSYSASSTLSSLPLLRGNFSLQRVSRSKLKTQNKLVQKSSLFPSFTFCAKIYILYSFQTI